MKQNNLIFEPENLHDCNNTFCDCCKFLEYRIKAKNPLDCEIRLQLPKILITENRINFYYNPIVYHEK